MTKVRKSIGAILLSIAMVFTMMPMMGGVQEAYAADVSSNVIVTDISLQHSSGGDVEIDKGDSTSNYSDGLSYGERFGFTFSWSMTTDHPVSNGDTATLPMTYSDMSIANTSAAPLLASDGTTEIGTWQKQGNNIILTFNENAATSTTWSGTCTSGTSFTRTGTKEYDEVKNFKIGNKTIKYKAILVPPSPLSKQVAGKTGGTASDTILFWNINFGQDGEVTLTAPDNADNIKDKDWGEANIQHHDVYFEDKLDDVVKANINGIYSVINYPMSDTDSRASGAAYTSISLMDRVFTRLYQEDGESLEAFRNRVKSEELQCGVYEDKDSGSWYVMVYLGDWPNQKIKYKDPDGRWNMYNSVTNSSEPMWTQGRKDSWLEKHAEDNCINGAVTRIRVNFSVRYTPVVVNTTKSNTADIDYDGIETTRSANNTMKFPGAEPSTVHRTVAYACGVAGYLYPVAKA